MASIRQKMNNRANQRYKNYLKKRTSDIRQYLETVKTMSDDEIRNQFTQLADNCKGNKDLIKKNIHKFFALGVEAIKRTVGLELYDVQIQGALALYEGNIAEMKTGEGKTITSALPVLLRSIDGPVHVCTVNEYLANRDKEILEPVYNYFGRTVSMNYQSDSRVVKQMNYSCDIVYGTASTFGFDYLYDNMVYSMEEKVYPDKVRHFALIDEVDLVLIDEARTPLVVGAPHENNKNIVLMVDKWVKQLTKDDYKILTKDRTVYLTESGEEKMIELTKKDIYSESHIYLLHLIHQSLVANYLYKDGVDYAIVNYEGEKRVAIIDTYTGRIQIDRRYSNGLHQAIEAKHSKEGVEIRTENKTVATITLQNFFRLYDNLAGMSGTAHEEQDELMQVYGLNVIQIDTNKPLRREENSPIIEVTKSDKWNTILNKVKDYHSNKKYPVLIGTVSVEDSEELSELFKKHKLPHTVLNAKQDKYEAEIIAQAGRIGAITIATNMAGRGTDIKPESDEHPLVVFVTELNESSRIDNQLKGRTSRQGALGIIETVLSAEDEIFRKTTLSDNLKRIRTGLSADSKYIVKLAKSVQSELESTNSVARQNSLKYDDIIREQRNLFYSARDKVLEIHDMQSAESIISKLELSSSVGEKIDNMIEEDSIPNFVAWLLLKSMDKAWVEHIDKLDSLKKGIGWRAQTGHNPIIIYQNEAQILYDKFVPEIEHNLMSLLNDVETERKKMNRNDSIYLEGGVNHNEMA